MTHGKAPGTGRLRTLHSRRSGPGRRRGPAGTHRERGSGTVLAVGLALVVMMAMALMLLLAQSAVLASRAAAAADLAALAAADALRGLAAGEPCTVAAEVAARKGRCSGRPTGAPWRVLHRSPFGSVLHFQAQDAGFGGVLEQDVKEGDSGRLVQRVVFVSAFG
jgi:hypothetical protein